MFCEDVRPRAHEEPLVRDGNDLKIGAMSCRRLRRLGEGDPVLCWNLALQLRGGRKLCRHVWRGGRRAAADTCVGWPFPGRAGAVRLSRADPGKTGVTSSHDLPARGGRYEIDGYHLALTGDDGAGESVSIFQIDSRARSDADRWEAYLKQ